MRIEIDSDRYPTPESVQKLEDWEGELSEIPAVLGAIADYFERSGYGRATRRGRTWRFATGGWSGCEEVIGAIPHFVRMVAWESTHRGGVHVYRMPEIKK